MAKEEPPGFAERRRSTLCWKFTGNWWTVHPRWAPVIRTITNTNPPPALRPRFAPSRQPAETPPTPAAGEDEVGPTSVGKQVNAGQ